MMTFSSTASRPMPPPTASIAMPVRGILSIPPLLQLPAWLVRILALLLLVGSLWSLPSWRQSIRKLLHSDTYSDVSRQWYCCLYVRNGVNPFSAANRALERTYGPVQGPDRIRLKDVRIWSVNTTQYDDQTPGLLPGTPPPEAGYPPSSLAICLALFGYLPPHVLLPYWALLNLICFLGLIWFLACPTDKTSRKRTLFSLLLCTAIFLVWPTTRLIFAYGQFTFFSLLFALLGLHYRTSRPWAASFFFSLSLIKPSLVLLFLIIPLLERNWRVLMGIALFHGLATLLIAGMVYTAPWVLIADWMNICRYLLQGSYTFQEIYNALGWENTWIATTLTLGIFGYCTIVCWRANNIRASLLLNLLCFANLMWTYHERHDFTLLAIPLAVGVLQWMAAPVTWRANVRWGTWIALFILMGIGLSDAAYTDLYDISHLMRWAGRIGIWTALFWLNVDFWRNWTDKSQKPYVTPYPAA
jgi:hypothetical protein